MLFFYCRETGRPRRSHKYNVLRSVFQENKTAVHIKLFIQCNMHAIELFCRILLLERDDFHEKAAGPDKRPVLHANPGPR